VSGADPVSGADLVNGADPVSGADPVGDVVVGDVGCGPEHVAGYLARLGVHPVGVDISPGMIEVARERHPDLEFRVGSFAELPVGDGGWAGAVVPYSIIHVPPPERPGAWAELARAIRTGGWLLVAVHVGSPDQPVGSARHFTEWWGHTVDLNFHFLDPAELTTELATAGFDLMSRTDRQPWPDLEYPSRRSYLLAKRR
jgi:SAM-dependent methyltransferase